MNKLSWYKKDWPRLDTTPIMDTNLFPPGSLLISMNSWHIVTDTGELVKCEGNMLSKATFPKLYETLKGCYGEMADKFGIPDLREPKKPFKE